jgi:putative redox protein
MEETPVEPEFAAFYEADRKQFPRVAATFLGGEQVMVHFTMQDLLIDHPVGVGGTGAGPSPGELLLGALAACTSVYVGRNARRHGVPVESVHVGVSFETAQEPTDGPLAAVSFLNRIVKRVEVRGQLTTEHVEMVRFWAERCAIGETLRRGVDLIEELELVTEPDVLPFGGRLPRHAQLPSDLVGSDTECCASEECDVVPDTVTHR